MAYAEKRGTLWRARWLGPDGTTESMPGFPTRKAAEDYGRDQEAAIRNNTYVDPRAGQITLTEWVNMWFPAQDLELNTLSTYKYLIEVHILPTFGGWSLRALKLQPEAVALWKKQIVARGYTRRTARGARSTLATILADAMPRYIRSNPAARKRGKGRKGQRRIERAEKAEKTWAAPLEVLLFAERCAVLSGADTDFVMLITMAYTGMRWSEAIGLPPECFHGQTLDIAWKLYELDARFYRGRPKDGSIRTADLPPSWKISSPSIWASLPAARAPAATPSSHGARVVNTSSSVLGTGISAARTTRRAGCARPPTAATPAGRDGTHGSHGRFLST